MSAKQTVVIFMALIGILACQKESDLISQAHLQKKSSTDYWLAAENTDNPYEHLAIGVYHNNCVEYFRLNYSDFSSQSNWIQARFQLTLDFFCFGGDTTYCNSPVTLNELTLIDSIALNDSLFEAEISNLSTQSYDGISILLGVYDNYTMTEYNDMKDAIVSFEYAVTSDPTSTEIHKEMLLIASQVARYSSLYWKEQIEHNFYGWNLSNYGDIEWKATSRHDVKGAIIGYLHGLNTNHEIASSIKGGPLTSLSSVIAATTQSN